MKEKILSEYSPGTGLSHFEYKVKQAFEHHQRELERKRELEVLLKKTVDTINSELNT